MKGSCDYAPWSAGADYVRTLPHASLTYVRRAGQDLYHDQPSRPLRLIRSYLLGRGVPTYPATTEPGDYAGPK